MAGRDSAEFKARVALDAIHEELTLAGLTKKHGVQFAAARSFGSRQFPILGRRYLPPHPTHTRPNVDRGRSWRHSTVALR
jgi:hypothetical protein